MSCFFVKYKSIFKFPPFTGDEMFPHCCGADVVGIRVCVRGLSGVRTVQAVRWNRTSGPVWLYCWLADGRQEFLVAAL
jgi:hypothetical protein